MFDQGLLIFDGAIGTELYERGFYINRPFEELNLSAPSDVQKVHEAYIEAGAQVITTNTFSITRPQLKKFDIENKQSELIEAALQIANRARFGKQVLIGLSIGPTGELIEPLGPTSHEEARGYFSEVAEKALRGSGFDLYILETFSNVEELEDAIIGIRSIDPLRPILASMTLRSSQQSLIEVFAEKIGQRNDVQALGINCSQGPSDLLTCLKKLSPLTDRPVVLQPNAGVPNHINGRYFYMTSPDYLAKYAKRYCEAGATGVGGCCGTGPAHIRAIRSALQMMNSKRFEVAEQRSQQILAVSRAKAKTWTERSESRVGQKLLSGEKVFSIEILPPKGTDLQKFLGDLERIEQAGVDFVNVPDGARASTRVSSLHLASKVNSDPKRKISVLPHLTTRDRNLIALQSDLLGAYINNVRDILVITGDPPKLGNNKDATGVFDIDSIGLAYLIDCLNRGQSPTGEELGAGTGFGIGVAANPTAINLELEIKRWRYKCESGADFAITQPIFDEEFYLRWRDSIAQSWKPHLVGIWPLVSLRNAEFLANEVPGIRVPQSMLEEMAKAGDKKEEGIKRGLDIAQKLIEKLSPNCDGFCVSAPLGKVDVALKAIEHHS